MYLYNDDMKEEQNVPIIKIVLIKYFITFKEEKANVSRKG